MEDDLLVAEIEIRAHGRDADPKIDDPTIAEFHRQPVAHLLAGKPFRPLAHRPTLPGRCGHHPSGGGGILTSRCTKIPAVCTSSGSMAPTGKMSSSTSTTVTRAAIAMTALKLRCDLRKRRLPEPSAWCARMH